MSDPPDKANKLGCNLDLNNSDYNINLRVRLQSPNEQPKIELRA